MLDALTLKLKIIDTTSKAKGVLNVKQHYFEYRDKPNKTLAQVLAESVDKPTIAEVLCSLVGAQIS